MKNRGARLTPDSYFRHRDDKPWVEESACRNMPTAVFYPARGETNELAKATCRDCPVRVPCLEYALTNGEHWGIWGGMAEDERRRIRRRRGAA